MTAHTKSDYLKQAVEHAQKTMRQGLGGPFGAVITTRDGTVLAVASNTVLGDRDPTAHAEINAIRQAGRVLQTHDLSDCILYATAYPCPMCLSAIIWANIRQVYYGCTPEEAAAIGFRDDFIYRYIRGEAEAAGFLTLHPMDKEEALALFEEYRTSSGIIY